MSIEAWMNDLVFEVHNAKKRPTVMSDVESDSAPLFFWPSYHLQDMTQLSWDMCRPSRLIVIGF